MDNKNTGTVKFFNAKKDSVLLNTMILPKKHLCMQAD